MVFACEADYEPLNEYSDVDWYTSTFGEASLVGVEDYLSFSDLSHNATSHVWSFSEESGCKFLTGGITRQDSTYYPFIDEEATTSSFDETVHILFTKAGLQNVRLRNTFDEYVSFKGLDTLEAVYQNGEWVIDTTFVVDVYDTIQSALKVFYEDVEIADANVNFDQQVFLADSASWPTIEIMAGESLKFVDMTTVGRPTDRTWYFNGGNPSTSTDSAAVAYFYKLGTFYSRLVCSRTGNNIPAGYKMKYVPLKVKVNKSNLPFELTGNIVEAEDETIKISVSGEVKAFSGLEDNFTVHVTNPNGFDQDIAVQSAKVSSSNGTIIELSLAEPIYNSDNITVSYVGNTIQSLDQRDLAAFTDVSVAMYKPNLVSDSGFESGGGMWQTPPTYDSSRIPTGLAEYSTDIVKDGAYSMHAVKTVDDANTAFGNSGSFVLEAGETYDYSFDYYVANDGGAVWESRISLANDDGTVNDGKIYGGWFNPSITGQWANKSAQFKGDGQKYTVAFLIYKGGASIDVYFDNFVVYKYEARPTE